MAPRVLIAGGYGLVGGTIGRLIRSISPQAELVLAGRHPEKGMSLANELGARSAYLDLGDSGSIAGLASVDLIVSALYDPANALLSVALTKGIAHIGITTKSEDVAPIVFEALRSPPKRPIVLLGYGMAGAAMLVAAASAQRFHRVDRIEVTGLFDPRDPVGPMTAADAEMLVSRALLRDGGNWLWVDGLKHPRAARLSGADTLEGYPTSLLDVPSLAALTGAANVRFDLAQGDSLGTQQGRAASSDVYIDIAGFHDTGEAGKQRTILSDPKGLAHLTALGVLIAAERVLGLDGNSPAEGGLYLPETLVAPDAAVKRLEDFGVHVEFKGERTGRDDESRPSRLQAPVFA